MPEPIRPTIPLIIVAVVGLALVFVFQESLVIYTFTNYPVSANTAFIFKKTLRVVLNDSMMLLLIYAWFNDRSITRLALLIQLIDTLLLLPIYLVLKLSLEGDGEISSPWLSQLHRLIVNPTLLVLLIPAIYFQRMRAKSG